MKRELRVEGLNKMMEVDGSHVNYLCDVIEEIALVDGRALRLLYPILDKLGAAAFYDPRLEEFVETHIPGEANYKMLLDWNTEIQREPKKKNNYILVKNNDIRTINYILDLVSSSNLDKNLLQSITNKSLNIFKRGSYYDDKSLGFNIGEDIIISSFDDNSKIKIKILDNVEYRMDILVFIKILYKLRNESFYRFY